VTAPTVISGHEMVADHEREREHAAGFRLVLIARNLAEHLPQISHAPTIDAPEPLGDCGVVWIDW
jgi:hypothetical protein